MTWQIGTAYANDPLKMRIEGMDCGACAIKIDGALKRLPGITNIQVNYATGTLSLRLDEGCTSRQRLEATIRGLGYTSVPFDAAAITATTRPPAKATRPQPRRCDPSRALRKASRTSCMEP